MRLIDPGFILVIDDNPANLSILTHTLKGTGYSVRVDVSGENALRQIEQELPALILLDVMMPGIDGFETCRRLKKNPATAAIPVIFITALADTDSKLQGLSAGAVDYVTKPFNEAEVLCRVRIHLKQQHLLHTLDTQNQQLKLEVQRRQQVEAELTSLNQVLEQRIAQRTTELQKTHLKLVQQEKLHTLGELVAGVAHEINNPISCIIGNLKFLQDYTTRLLSHVDLCQEQVASPNQAINDHAHQIELTYILQDLPNLMQSMQSGSQRIAAISQSLRTFIRYDSRKKQKIDLHEGLDSTLLILRHRLKPQENRAGIDVVKAYGTLPAILCFPDQINQVFMNILANAIDAFDEYCLQHKHSESSHYCHRDKMPLQIYIETEAQPDGVSIRIRDNAGGMTETVKSHIFEYAYTTKAVGKGTGMGLSIAHQIVVETHAGQLTCTSRPGEGTQFSIDLPYDADTWEVAC